jgi:hypothetical protein
MTNIYSVMVYDLTVLYNLVHCCWELILLFHIPLRIFHSYSEMLSFNFSCNTLFYWSKYCSSKIVALWKNLVDRPENYDSSRAKSCAFITQENVRWFCTYFPHFFTQFSQKNGIKNSPDICQLTSFLYLPQIYFKLSRLALKFKLMKLEWFPLKGKHFNSLNFRS